MSGVLFGAYLQTLSSGKLVPNIAILLGIVLSCIFSYVKGVFGFGMVVLSLTDRAGARLETAVHT